MAVDVGAEIRDAILKTFYRKVGESRVAKKCMEQLNKGSATTLTANKYADVLGRIMESAYKEHMSSAVLPNGKCYFNIGETVMYPTEEAQQKLVAEFIYRTQKLQNEKAKIGINPIKVKDDKTEVKSLIDLADSAVLYDDVALTVSQGIGSMSMRVVDAAILENAEFLKQAGVDSMIIRTAESKCCDWCEDLAGVYQYYSRINPDLFKRHNNCRCTIEHVYSTGKVITF